MTMHRTFQRRHVSYGVILAGLFVVLWSFLPTVFAQVPSCKLTGASWSTSSPKTQEPIILLVSGQNCNGFTVAIHVFVEADTRKMVSNFNVVFHSSTQAQGQYRYADSDIPTGLQSATTFYEASANNTKVVSQRITVTRAAKTPTPVPQIPPPQGPVPTVSYLLDLPNPLGVSDLLSLLNQISVWLTNLAIPVAVVMIVWAGLRFLWARGDKGEVSAAKQILLWAVIGLSIIVIGRGFVSLIYSILDVEQPAPTESPEGNPPPNPNQLPTE